MSVYQKNIIYLYVYQDDAKLQNAGFVKMEHVDKRYGLYAGIKNAGEDISGEFDVYMKEGDGKRRFCVGRMILQKGRGDFKVVWNARQVEDIENLWQSFEIIEILLDEKRRLLGMNKKLAVKAVEDETESLRGERPEQEMHREMRQDESERTAHAEPERTMHTEPAGETGSDHEIHIEREPERENGKEIVEYETDKWKELLRTYPNVHPFGDERCYITLEPKDFPLLTEEYQHLSGNSFLLHGFYNYRHVILGKEDDYLLGVPGTYHEREKMVALMFGFEGFESENKNPRTGTFGYYMRKVKI